MGLDKTVAIIQARMGSQRLPGKVLMKIEDQPMLKLIIRRAQRSRRIDQVAVATSTQATDDPISDLCAELGIFCYRGSENDVLDRFYQASRILDGQVLVRITGDCPLLDSDVLDRIIDARAEAGSDYATNTLIFTYPHGLDAEVFTMQALERAWTEAKMPSEREHLTRYIRSSGKFSTLNVKGDVDLSPRNLRWTVDEPRDMEFARAVYSRLHERFPDRSLDEFRMKDVLDLLEREPRLEEINRGFVRHEGAYKSILTDPPMEFSKLIGGDSLDQAVFVRAEGSRIWDRHGNEWIDWDSGEGKKILGHQQKPSELRPPRLISEVTKLLSESIPGAEAVALTRQCVEASALAVKLAKQGTGRDRIIDCRRWNRREGAETVCHTWEQLESVSAESSSLIAALVVEPISMESHDEGFLRRARQWASHHGALLIMDETLSGFRLALGGAQEYFKVDADLAFFGENLSNGLPLGAVTGRSEFLRQVEKSEECELASVAAAHALLLEIRSGKVIGQLWDQGKKFKDGMEVFIRHERLEGLLKIEGFAPGFRFVFQDAQAAESESLSRRFREECYQRHIRLGEQIWVSFSHSFGDIDKTLRAGLASLRSIRQEGKIL